MSSQVDGGVKPPTRERWAGMRGSAAHVSPWSGRASQFSLASVQLMDGNDLSTFCLKNRIIFGFPDPRTSISESTSPSVCAQGTARFYVL